MVKAMTKEELKAFFKAERLKHRDDKPEVGQYKCFLCGQVCEYGDEEEAVAELKRDFPQAERKHCGVICDDCHQKIKPSKRPTEYGEYQAELN